MHFSELRISIAKLFSGYGRGISILKHFEDPWKSLEGWNLRTLFAFEREFSFELFSLKWRSKCISMDPTLETSGISSNAYLTKPKAKTTSNIRQASIQWTKCISLMKNYECHIEKTSSVIKKKYHACCYVFRWKNWKKKEKKKRTQKLLICLLMWNMKNILPPPPPSN